MSNSEGKGLEITLARMLTTLKAKVDPSHTVLIIVDMQNDFCSKGGMMDREGLDIKLIQAMVPRLAKFIDKARAAKLPIIFIQAIYGTNENWYLSDVWLEQMKRTGKGKHIAYPVCQEGSWGADFCEGIKPLPEELVIQKHRYSAFVNTKLNTVLRSKGIRTLIMAGVATNICVESMARDGFMLDYYIVFLRDCTATTSEEMHNNTLANMARSFGEVVDSSAVAKCWEEHIGTC
jgi:ureidoacrylate peracid hydrolase